eukprot:5744120-Prymnesium_polylepis.2
MTRVGCREGESSAICLSVLCGGAWSSVVLTVSVIGVAPGEQPGAARCRILLCPGPLAGP